MKRRSGTLQWGGFILPLALLACTLVPGCGGKKVESRWAESEIVLNGIPDEWQGSRTYIDRPNIALGVMNDETYLYIALSTPVRSVVARILGRGLTIWFEPKGRGDRKFGIRCPMGVEDSRPAGGAPEGPGKMEDPARIREMVENAAARLEVIGPGDDDTAILLNDGRSGITVAMGYRDGNFGYELRVPLAIEDERDYGIGGDPGKPIRIGFETPKVNTEEMREAMGYREPPAGGIGDRPGGGMPSGGTPLGGMGDDGMRGGMRGSGFAESIKVWITVSLAEPVETSGNRPE